MAISRQFRSDHLGPLAPPPAFAQAVSGLQGDALRAALDEAIITLLELQRDSWISIATDGDLRARFAPAWADAVADARFATQHADILVKVSLRRAGDAIVNPDTLRAVIDLGASYVQLDGSAYTPFITTQGRAALSARGIDADAQLTHALERDAKLLAALPADKEFKLGVAFQDLASAAPAPFAHDLHHEAAQRVLHGLPVDRFLFDCSSAANPDFGFLRLLPAHAEATLGLIDVREALPAPSDLVRRIDAAAQIIDTDRLALSPRQPLAFVPAHDADDAWQRQQQLLTLLLNASSEAWGIDF